MVKIKEQEYRTALNVVREYEKQKGIKYSLGDVSKELPSDEEILEKYPNTYTEGTIPRPKELENGSRREGAKWMRDRILQ